MPADPMTSRERLARLVSCLDTLLPSPNSTAWAISDRIIAAGWHDTPLAAPAAPAGASGAQQGVTEAMVEAGARAFIANVVEPDEGILSWGDVPPDDQAVTLRGIRAALDAALAASDPIPPASDLLVRAEERTEATVSAALEMRDAEIARLRREIAELREALAPFAQASQQAHESHSDESHCLISVTAGDLRRASALRATDREGGR